MAGISPKAACNLREQIRKLPWLAWQNWGIEEISAHCQNRLMGWMNYFKLFGESEIRNVLFYFDKCLRRWMMRKQKCKTVMQAARGVNSIRRKAKHLFAHWSDEGTAKGWVA